MRKNRVLVRILVCLAGVLVGALTYFVLCPTPDRVTARPDARRAKQDSITPSHSLVLPPEDNDEGIPPWENQEDTHLPGRRELHETPVIANDRNSMKDNLRTLMRTLYDVCRRDGVGPNLIGTFGDDTSLDKAHHAMNRAIWESEESFFAFLEVFLELDDEMRWVVMQYLSPGAGKVPRGGTIFSRSGVDRLVEMLTGSEHDLATYRVLGIALCTLARGETPFDATAEESSLLLSHDNAKRLVKWLQDGFAFPAELERRIMVNADFRYALARYVRVYPEVRTMFLAMLREEGLGKYLRQCVVMHALAHLDLDDEEVFSIVLSVLNTDPLPEDDTLLWYQRSITELFYRNRMSNYGAKEWRKLEAFYEALNGLRNRTACAHLKAAIGRRVADDNIRLSQNPMEQIARDLSSPETPLEAKIGMLDRLRKNATPLHLLFTEAFSAEEIQRRDAAVSLLYSVVNDTQQAEKVRAQGLQILMEYYSEYAKKHPASREEHELLSLIAAGKTDKSEVVRQVALSFEAAFRAPQPATEDEDDEEEGPPPY